MNHSTSYGGSLVQIQTQATPSPLGRRMRPSASVPDFTQQSQQQQQQQEPHGGAPSNTSSPQTSQPGTAPRNVRFTTDASAGNSPLSSSSPRRTQLSHYPNLDPGATSSTPSSFSPVPLTRVLSNGSTPLSLAPTALGSPSPRFPIARPLSTSASASASASPSNSRELSHINTNKSATPHRSFSSGWTAGAGNSTPVKAMAPLAPAAVTSSTVATSVAATRSSAASSPKPELSTIERRALPPMTRQEVARRLRTNAVLLVLWWISSRTQVYKYTSDHLSDLLPSLSTPLNLLEKGLFILLCYNVADSMRSLNSLSSLTPPRPSTPSKSSSSPHLLHRTVPGTPQFSAPVQSSPKTRSTCFASPSILPGGSPLGGSSSINSMSGSPTRTFRASAMSSPQPPSPQTPASSSRPIVASALRKSYVGELRTNASPSTQGSPLGTRGVAGTPTMTSSDTEEMSSLKSSLIAYMARHEPSSHQSRCTAPKISVDSQEAIDRMFESS
ncbi:BZ3500_MvSof-1268-A1-R1_Chr1-3g01963 [Microbotryum saponariae]|uniref:BZ3500_MvSof-1268-A1-R1_Chr1-3g01963 protein n=1 Tax=Microbotryum saponariae TaxID=289078 RepID=A0A2X0MRE5_9BASI|nr:BZ3500_MvSof-1268-A1-R1_Chr1-3g01963 [Microbotryum saponariae]SCZ95034.1 BZ3501_MvSof-1269-A2-R1_Chr1-3g01565 [Microbotryum saponariae]